MKQTYLLDIVGDPEKQTVELRMQSETVALTFTDKPISAKAPRPERPGQRLAHAVEDPATAYGKRYENPWKAWTGGGMGGGVIGGAGVERPR